MKDLKRLRAGWPVLCALLSGLLFARALPPFDAEWLGWFALAPLLVAGSVPGRRALHAAGLGMLAGAAAGVFTVGRGDGVAPDRLSFAYLPYLWIGFAFALTGVLIAAIRRRLRREAPSWFWGSFIACAGVAVEWLTTLSPLPVGVALCQHMNVPLVQVASVAGIWGVSFLLWWVNGALAELALARRAGMLPACVAVFAAVLVCGGGYRHLRTLPALEMEPTVLVAAVQDYSGTDGTDPNGMRSSSGGGDLPDSDALMRRAAAQGARLVVGSEEALGSAFTPDDRDSDPAALARRAATCLVVGYQKLSSPKDFNCAALVGRGGRIRGVHRKVHLFLGERNAVEAGQNATVADSGDPGLGRVGLLICFDTCWTGLVREEAARGARVIALPNFDPPTPHAVLHYLHAALMPFRAAENGVAIVRADPNGLSQIVDPWGRVVAQAPLYRAEVVAARIPLGRGQSGTLFTRWGDWLAYLCLGIVAASVGGASFGRRRHDVPKAIRAPDRLRTSP